MSSIPGAIVPLVNANSQSVAEDEFQNVESDTPWLIFDEGVMKVLPIRLELTPHETPVYVSYVCHLQ